MVILYIHHDTLEKILNSLLLYAIKYIWRFHRNSNSSSIYWHEESLKPIIFATAASKTHSLSASLKLTCNCAG